MNVSILLLLAVTTGSWAYDEFSRKFAYTQVMANCFGKEVYLDYAKMIVSAYKTCHSEPMRMLHGDDDKKSQPDLASGLMELLKGDKPVLLPLIINQQGDAGQRIFDLLSQSRQKREAIYDADLLKSFKHMAMAKVSNFTCVLQKLDMVDSDLNLEVADMKEMVRSSISDPILRKDMVEAVDYCNDFSMCMPQKEDSPLPTKLQQILAFVKCDKMIRMSICMKHDFMRNMDMFDLSGLPLGNKDEEMIAEKLLHLLWGVDSKDAFEIY
ncbi:hypothetical protein SK128_007562 [Halocaridina rubra]|uniref:Uncharacterized protein n=1 Tax=Halocaridina rubra TaxID=373956 RepID=A0AAN8XD69_HALRR